MEAAMLIGGEWRQAASNEEIEVVNPATEDVVSSVPSGDVGRRRPRGRDGEAGVPGVGRDRHREARPHPGRRRGADRGAREGHSRRCSPPSRASRSSRRAARSPTSRTASATTPRRPRRSRGTYQDLPSAFGPAYGQVIRRPMGVCAAITPYNFPLTLLGTKVAPALVERQHGRRQAGGDDAARDARGRAASSPRPASRTAC